MFYIKKCKNTIIEYISSDTKLLNFRYYLLLASLFMLFGHFNQIDILITIIISCLFLIFYDRDEFVYSYFALIFFEAVLNIPYIAGISVFRIYQMIFIFRIVMDYKKTKKSKFKKVFDYNINIIAGIIFFLLSLIYITNFTEAISYFINISILIYITILGKDKNVAYSKILAIISIFSIFSGIYGVLFINPIYNRYSAVIGDPNYSALFYTLGIFSLIGTKAFCDKLKIILGIILCFLLVLTVSISGILGTILLFVLYLFIINPKKAMVILLILTIIFFVFINMNLEYLENTPLQWLQLRIISIIESSDLSTITSNRSDLFTTYSNYFIKEIPLINKLIGGANIINGPFRDYMIEKIGVVSHNSYMDMIYMVGILGTIIILIFFIIMIVDLMKKYANNNTVYLSMVFLKVTILYYSMNISIFPFRYYYTFFIL